MQSPVAYQHVTFAPTSSVRLCAACRVVLHSLSHCRTLLLLLLFSGFTTVVVGVVVVRATQKRLWRHGLYDDNCDGNTSAIECWNQFATSAIFRPGNVEPHQHSVTYKNPRPFTRLAVKRHPQSDSAGKHTSGTDHISKTSSKMYEFRTQTQTETNGFHLSINKGYKSILVSLLRVQRFQARNTRLKWGDAG